MNISYEIKNLINSIEKEDVEVDIPMVKGWIEDCIDQLEKRQIIMVTMQLMNMQPTLKNFLGVYSYMNECINS
jgi:hypothetical protein